MSSMPQAIRTNPALTGSPQRARRSAVVWDPAEAGSSRDESARFDERVEGLSRIQLDAHQSAESIHLTGCRCIRTGHREGRGNERTGLLCDLPTSRRAPARCRTDAPNRRPAVPRLRCASHVSKGPSTVPERKSLTLDLPTHRRIGGGDVTHQEVTEPAESLGTAGHHDVGTQFERALTQRCRGRVVDDQQRTRTVAHVGEHAKVDHVQHRVGRCLGDDDPRGPVTRRADLRSSRRPSAESKPRER